MAGFPSSLRLAVGHFAELAGFALMAVLFWRVFFELSPSVDMIGAATGLAGITSAWALGKPLRTSVDAPVVGYVLMTLVSAIVNQQHYLALLGDQTPLPPWQPAIHVAALALYFFGASVLLATPRRLGVLVTAFVVTLSVFGVHAAYDHLLEGLGSRPLDYSSLSQWTGYAPLGLLFALGFALALAAVVVGRSPMFLGAAIVVASMFLVDTIGVYSRAANVSIASACAFAAAVELRKLSGRRLVVAALVAVIALSVVLGLSIIPRHSVTQFLTGEFYVRGTPQANIREAFRRRLAIWSRAAVMIRDHPWVGVGPGHYTDAMRKTYYAGPLDYGSGVYLGHAHSMILHVAAEQGIPALMAFLVIWWVILARLVAACTRDHVGLLAVAICGALVVFFVRNLVDHFLATGLVVSDRLGFVLWTLFAAAVAVVRLRQNRSPLSVAARLPHGPNPNGAITA